MQSSECPIVSSYVVLTGEAGSLLWSFSLSCSSSSIQFFKSCRHDSVIEICVPKRAGHNLENATVRQ